MVAVFRVDRGKQARGGSTPWTASLALIKLRMVDDTEAETSYCGPTNVAGGGLPLVWRVRSDVEADAPHLVAKTSAPVNGLTYAPGGMGGLVAPL